MHSRANETACEGPNAVGKCTGNALGRDRARPHALSTFIRHKVYWFSDVTDACDSGAPSGHRDRISLHRAVHCRYSFELWPRGIKMLSVQVAIQCIRGHVRVCYRLHHFATQPIHVVDRAGWLAKMVSVEFWIQRRNAHGYHCTGVYGHCVARIACVKLR